MTSFKIHFYVNHALCSKDFIGSQSNSWQKNLSIRSESIWFSGRAWTASLFGPYRSDGIAKGSIRRPSSRYGKDSLTSSAFSPSQMTVKPHTGKCQSSSESALFSRLHHLGWYLDHNQRSGLPREIISPYRSHLPKRGAGSVCFPDLPDGDGAMLNTSS